MWALSLPPKKPFVNMAISVVFGSSIATVLYTVYMLLMMCELQLTLSHVVWGGLASLLVSPIYAGVNSILFFAPIMWAAVNLGYAGPLTVVSIVALISLLLGFHDASLILYPAMTTAVYVLLAYPSLRTSIWRRVRV